MIREQLSRALLATERQMRVELERAARGHMRDLFIAMGESSPGPATLYRSVARQSRAFEADARGAILAGRGRARDASLLLVSALFAGASLGAMNEVDNARAELAARGLAQSFAGIAAGTFGAWLLSGKPAPALAIPQALRRFPSSVERTASTENSNAFNGALREVSGANLNARLVEWEWDAALDRRTCSVCRDMHGVVTEGGSFRGGLWPGSVHPRCRCLAYPLMNRWRSAA